EKDREIQELQNQSDIANAELALKLVKLDLDKFDLGEKVQMINELQGQLALDEENLKRAQESYEFQKDNAKKGYITQNQLEAARLAVQSAQLKVNSSREKLRVYNDFEQVRKKEELEANAKEFERELQRVHAK